MLELRPMRIVVYLCLLILAAGCWTRASAAPTITARDGLPELVTPDSDDGAWTISGAAEKFILNQNRARSLEFLSGTDAKYPAQVWLYRTDRTVSNPFFNLLLKNAATRARMLATQHLEFAAFHTAARTGYYSSHTTTPPPSLHS